MTMNRSERWLRGLTVFLLLALAGALLWAVVLMPSSPQTAAQLAAAALPQSGVENPVTAVLLNFRGYDTLLETGVLLLALIGVWALGAVQRPLPPLAPNPMLETVARRLAPLMLLVAAYLLWIGASRPGGAFQAGAVLAAAVLLLLFSGLMPGRFRSWPPRRWRWGAVLGLLVFVLAATVLMLLEGHLLQYPPGQAGGWLLLIETALMLSVALTLVGLFLGAELRPRGGRGHE